MEQESSVQQECLNAQGRNEKYQTQNLPELHTKKAAKPIRFVKNNKNPCFNLTKYFNLSLNQRMTKN